MKTTDSQTEDQHRANRTRWRGIRRLATLLLVSCLPARAELISDFDDGQPDYDFLGLRWGEMDVQEDGALNMTLRSGPVASVDWNRTIDLKDGKTVEITADVDRTSASGGAMLGFKQIRADNTEIGYYALIAPGWIGVYEYWFNLNAAYNPEWTMVIPNLNTPPELATATVGLRMETVANGVKITLSAWDQAPQRTRWVHEVATDFETGGVHLGEPFRSFTGVFVGVIDLMGAQSGHQTMDNLNLTFRTPNMIGARRAGEEALEVSWTGTPEKRYRLYRSDGDLEHFYPMGTVLTAGEEPLVARVPITDTPCSFFKHHEVPPSVALSALRHTRSEFASAVRGHDPGKVVATFDHDFQMDDVAELASRNRAETEVSYEELFRLFPDYTDTPGLVLTARIVEMGQGWVLSEVLWIGHNTGPYWGTPATGAEVILRGVALDHITPEGLADYSHVYFDNVTMLAQMGLLAPPAP